MADSKNAWGTVGKVTMRGLAVVVVTGAAFAGHQIGVSQGKSQQNEEMSNTVVRVPQLVVQMATGETAEAACDRNIAKSLLDVSKPTMPETERGDCVAALSAVASTTPLTYTAKEVVIRIGAMSKHEHALK